GGEAGGRTRGELGPQRLEVAVVLDVELAVLGVVALRLLVHHGVPDEAGLVVEGLARGGLVLLADLEVVVPRGVRAAEQLRDGLAVAGQAGRGEELAVVAEPLRSDVGAIADDPAALVGGLLELPVDP